jgi:hypothetical protein
VRRPYATGLLGIRPGHLTRVRTARSPAGCEGISAELAEVARVNFNYFLTEDDCSGFVLDVRGSGWNTGGMETA